MTLDDWALKWAIPSAAIADLRHLADVPRSPENPLYHSEAAAQSDIRYLASLEGHRLWRNNVGVLEDKRGVPVRYGLANDSKQMNQLIKSGDCIGVYRLLITPEHVGKYVGQFWSVEAKEVGWKPSNSAHDRAQMVWAALIQSLGGRAEFWAGRS